MLEGHEQTDGLLKELTSHSKRLKGLRDKRDQLRAALEETEQVIRVIAADISKLTAQLADDDTKATSNGKK